MVSALQNPGFLNAKTFKCKNSSEVSKTQNILG
jgi:hypothetical protein